MKGYNFGELYHKLICFELWYSSHVSNLLRDANINQTKKSSTILLYGVFQFSMHCIEKKQKKETKNADNWINE